MQNMDFLEKIIWCWYKFCFRDVPGILQVSENPSDHTTITQPLGQQTSRSMLRAHKTNYVKCLNTNNDVNPPLLQICFIPISPDYHA